MKVHAPGYNPPDNFAMFISQWAHLGFLHGWWTYERYVRIQNLAYRLLHKEPS